MTNKTTGRGPLGPRGRILNLKWKDPKPKKPKKEKIISKPKRTKKKINQHNPKVILQHYHKIHTAHPSMEEILKIIESHKLVPDAMFDIPNITTYEVEYLDEDDA